MGVKLIVGARACVCCMCYVLLSSLTLRLLCVHRHGHGLCAGVCRHVDRKFTTFVRAVERAALALACACACVIYMWPHMFFSRLARFVAACCVLF
jgi:hypothetical protein